MLQRASEEFISLLRSTTDIFSYGKGNSKTTTTLNPYSEDNTVDDKWQHARPEEESITFDDDDDNDDDDEAQEARNLFISGQELQEDCNNDYFMMLDVLLSMGPYDKRFGFSVIGGVDEGITAYIDCIVTGSPADKADLEVGDEILEVNGKCMEEATHTEVISHIHQCIRSRTICLRVKRRSGNRLAYDLAGSNSVQDAFVIAVEQQARERLERLSALRRIKPVDMNKLSQQLNEIPSTEHQKEINGFIEKSPIYVASISDQSTAEKTRKSRSPTPDDGDTGSEIELKQELYAQDSQSRSNSSRVSAFFNGRTEVLIGQDQNSNSGVRTTAVIEHNRLAADDPSVQLRPRRRSGSSIVVVGDEPLKVHPADADRPEDVNMMMTMLDSGPHREMPVDVPDSFIAMSKTPPRYPPPPRQQGTPMLNGSAKPVPPPRDHIRIEKDGRLTSRLPAPQVPARGSSSTPPVNNNNQQPTKQELESIRKFEEIIRQRKEDEERAAKEAEFLKGSLRGSKKLQALESHPPLTGVVNNGYTEEEYSDTKPTELIHKIIGYGELVAALQRLQHQLKKSNACNLSGVEHQLGAVQSVLLSPHFGHALSVCNKVQEVTLINDHQCLAAPQPWRAQDLVRDCIQILEPCTLPEATELHHILSTFEMEGLLFAHDTIASGEVVCLKDVRGVANDSSMIRRSDSCQEQVFPGIKVVKIEKSNEPLGATVRNEGDAVVIGRVVKGGAADKSGLLREGDEVLQVNGVEMRGKSIHEVCDILAGMIGTLTFYIIPGHTPRNPVPSTQTALVHMKALFDYDPEDDAYIPCKELGIGFSKGDILHVISQEDPNWWQAFRDGEDDQLLAGLIPSHSFQHQRESLKQQITGDRFSKEKNKKASTLLCAKKHKKKKKTSHAPYHDGNYPLYSSSTDDYDADEILTYEEVALYYPRRDQKRPIVLIGPQNIGRQELREKLIEDSDRFAPAIPHTSRPPKENEVDGQDYHFITRAQFEADILARKFVEYGVFEKSYYGTTIEAIRTVVNSGKICVLNLYPQSLKILRSCDLKPYVVFVAPPSLERLRQKKNKRGEVYKDEELKEIIEKAREMEDKYGHLLDMIIINNDTDRAYKQLIDEINCLEREPQWVPAAWVRQV